VNGLTDVSRKEPQEGQGKRQPPEASGYRPRVRQPDQPWAEGQRDIAEQQRQIGKAVGA
jgi:hypothetical protein